MRCFRSMNSEQITTTFKNMDESYGSILNGKKKKSQTHKTIPVTWFPSDTLKTDYIDLCFQMSRKWLPLGRGGFWRGGDIKGFWGFWLYFAYSSGYWLHRCAHFVKIYWAPPVWFMYFFSLLYINFKSILKRKNILYR